MTGQFSWYLSKLYVGFLHFLPTNSYQKIFRLKAPFPRSQKRRTLWDFGRFSDNFPGGTNYVYKWPIIILWDLSTRIMSYTWRKLKYFQKRPPPRGPGPHFGAHLWKSARTWIFFLNNSSKSSMDTKKLIPVEILIYFFRFGD